MGEAKNQYFQDIISMNIGMNNVFPMVSVRNNQWVVMGGDEEFVHLVSKTSSEDEEEEDSTSSIGSCSSSEFEEDASSSSSNSYSSSEDSSSKGPLYELSELISQLPMKRGLSKHFQGKSQSFTSLSNVKSLEDLAKKEDPYKKRMMMMKSCKSYGGGLDNPQKSYTPKTSSKIITKKSSNRGSFSSLLGKRNGFVNCGFSKPPLHQQNNF